MNKIPAGARSKRNSKNTEREREWEREREGGREREGELFFDKEKKIHLKIKLLFHY